jgi:glycine cleavage system H protein
MTFPEDLKYTKDHEWIRVEGATGTVGITDYAQGELGDVVYVDITASGAVGAHQSFGSIEAVKTVADLNAPVSGTIASVNQIIKDTPETLNKDPYGDGWIVQITLSNPAELGELMDVAAYKALIGL